MKGKGEKERLYPPECKVTKNSRGGKKAFLSEQCKEIEENNRMRNKIRDTNGTCHAKMSTIKNRNGMDLTEAEDIKKWWQEYTEELYKTDLNDLDNNDSMITHLSQTSWSVKSSGSQEASP